MESLFTRSVPKRGRVALMLAGSLVFHGGLVGIGALVVQPPPPVVDVYWPPPEGPDLAPVKVSDPVDQPTVDSGPTATPETVEPAVFTPPPVADDPVFAEPSSPTPRQRATMKPVTAAPPNTARTASRAPALPGSGPSDGMNGSPAAGAAWVMPHPPYPAAVRHLMSGTGTTLVRITTDAAGRISNVAVVRSTGNPILDAHTVSYVRDHWRGPANASRTTEFVYELR